MSHQFRRLQIWLLQLHICKHMVIGGESCCLGYRQQPGCSLFFLLSFHSYNLGCNSVGTDTNATTILKCFVTMVYHNIAHDILMSHRFRRLQIWLLQLHIRKQMAIGGEFGTVLAVWDIASNRVTCYCSYHRFMLIICLCFLQDLCGGHR